MGIFDVTEEKKQEYWNHFMTLKKEYWPPEFTPSRLKKVKAIIWEDFDFWADVIHRHGGNDKSPEQMKANELFTYEHCMGNMMGMLFHTMIDKGIIKP